MQDILLKSEKDTFAIASCISKILEIGDIVTFAGDLGSGKTSFCRYLIQEIIGKKTEVLSPTFNLVQQYDTSDIKVLHYDLYRIKNIEELYEIGFEDFLEESITLVEWPEIAESVITGNRISIKLEFATKNSRTLKISGYNKFKDINTSLVTWGYVQ